MRREETDALVVVDGDTTVGVLTAADIVEGVTTKGLDASAVPVRDVCRRLVFGAPPDQEITEVLVAMPRIGARGRLPYRRLTPSVGK